MKKMIKNTLLGLALAGGLSVACAEGVDTSVDGIFNALTTTSNLQATVDNLVASGANPQSIVSVAAAAGIPLDTVKDLQVCVNSAAPDATVLSASCMRQRSLVTAYAAGVNDPMKYLPATAAGKRQSKEVKTN
ncbi:MULTISPECIES: hypothetical protein [unclassified Undibacterium]|jgi:hypothetical protein|uniref:hypothetical protein n=1 Tax=unclassified Undibacterium TaxID=2630295 RepID=UPI001331FC30|nr:hypothetical protein [Undibacterium sp. KW1]BBB60022.1 hypothetical protein UNDKW_1749 [Undibacterium sp. KW1]